MGIREQMRALGKKNLPGEFVIAGRRFRLVYTFKHNFVSAVGRYRCGPEEVVLKCYREAPFLGLPLSWTGGLTAAYEAAVLQRVDGLPGVPRLVGSYGRAGIVRQYVPGRALTKEARVGDSFFPELIKLLDEMHQRGVAYFDLEKPANILLGGDGRPYLIDFQLAFFVPERYLGETGPVRLVREWLEKSDIYHARKHWRRLRPDQLTDEEIAGTHRRPWAVRASNSAFAPFKKLRRWMLGKL